MQHLTNTNEWLSHYLYAYTAGPALGGVFAGLFFLMHEKCHPKPEENESEQGSRLNSEAHKRISEKGGSYRGVHEEDSNNGSNRYSVND